MKDITYKLETYNDNKLKSNIYTVDIVHKGKRYKYTYSLKKYGIYAEKLANMMATLLNEAINSGTIDLDTIKKIKNYYEVEGDSVRIHTRCAANDEMKVIIVDKEDFNAIKDYYWSASNTNHNFNNVYAVATVDGKQIRMSHLLLGCKGTNTVRYKNGNPLDNRRENMVLADYSPRYSKGITMGAVASKSNIGRIRAVGNSFLVKYLENDEWLVKEFKLSDYKNMEEAYKQAKIFRKTFNG